MQIPTTHEERAALRAAAERATPRPWTWGVVPKDEEPDTCLIGSAGMLWARVVGSPGRSAEADADYIERACAITPRLADDVDRLESERDEARDRLASELASRTEERDRLKRGDFTPEEFQSLCHHRDEKPNCTATDFYEGCHLYQQKLFGASERDFYEAMKDGFAVRIAGVEATVTRLAAENAALRAALQRMVDGCRQRSTHSALEPCQYCDEARRLLDPQAGEMGV